MSHAKFSHFLWGAAAACALAAAPVAHAEKAAGGTDKSDAQFAMMDGNGDGKVTPEEHAAGARKMFDMMDANKDGKVTAAEMDAAQEKMDKMAGAASKAAPKGSQGHEMSSAEKIKVVDKDGDGILTAEEHAAGSSRMFDVMDTNKDGSLTRGECAAGHAKMMHAHGK